MTILQKFLDQLGEVLWKRILLYTCIVSIFVDPLFYYIVVINEKNKCVDVQESIRYFGVLRTVLDIFYIFRIFINIRKAFVVPPSSSLAFGRIYYLFCIILDILSIVPVLQVCIIFKLGSLIFSYLLLNNAFRIFRAGPLILEVYKTSTESFETTWAVAYFPLMLYLWGSHLTGAFWYIFLVHSKIRCWAIEIERTLIYKSSYLTCGSQNQSVVELLNNTCSFVNPDQIRDLNGFKYGIFSDAIESRVIESTTTFAQKLSYCFMWGFQNLSSLGTNLHPSTFVSEIVFAFIISFYSLVLFSALIANVQRYLQLDYVGVEEMRQKRREMEQWLSHQRLPREMKDRVRSYERYNWQERGDVEDKLLCQLPKYLRRDIKRHLCLDLVKNVPFLKKIDELLLDVLWDRLQPLLYTTNSIIVHEGNLVEEMIFVRSGNLNSMSTNGGTTGFYNSFPLTAGDFCGEELLKWALDPKSPSNLPIATRTVKTISEVKAFAITADDLKLIARHLPANQFYETFRKDIMFSSVEMKTRAAIFIQLAWRKYQKKKIESSLPDKESKIVDILGT